jgi:hypothetical protein
VNPMAPWHMWGTDAQLSVSLGGAFARQASHQLARITYKRPETWRFFLFARLVGGTVPAVQASHVFVDIDVVVGVGRASFGTTVVTTPPPVLFQGFCRFAFQVPIGTRPGDQPWNLKYATQVTGPVLDDFSGEQRTIDLLVSENIQCSAADRGILRPERSRPPRLV